MILIVLSTSDTSDISMSSVYSANAVRCIYSGGLALEFWLKEVLLPTMDQEDLSELMFLYWWLLLE